MSSVEGGEKYINKNFKLDGWEMMKPQAMEFVKKYEKRLTKIMEHMGIKSEAEIMVSIVNQVGKYQSKGFHDIEELQEQLERQVRHRLNSTRLFSIHTYKFIDIQWTSIFNRLNWFFLLLICINMLYACHARLDSIQMA